MIISPPAEPRPVVAHVNYLFFHSTQSFIHFYLSHLRRTLPLCLTRAPESAAVRSEIPPSLAGDFHVYGAPSRRPRIDSILRDGGLKLQSVLSRFPPTLAEPMLECLHRRVVPRLRSDAHAGRHLDWVEGILRRRGADIIHAYFGPLGWHLLALKRKLGLPLVVTFLGDEMAPDVGAWWQWLIRSGSEKQGWPDRLRELLAEGDLFLVEGPFLRRRLIDLGCAPDKVRIQRIALPLQCIRPRPAPPARADGKVVLLFAGRFCEQKGVLYVLEAMRELRRERRDLELRLIGDEKLTDGRYAARIYAYLREHRMRGVVRLLGFMNHDEYLEEMKSADIFVHPSVVDSNGASEGGAPTTILEAQALGIPVVSSEHCDIPYVTVPGESALLVPERDSAALASALRLLLDDPARREEMGRSGRRHIERFHDIEREAPLLEERYFELLERRRGLSPGALGGEQAYSLPARYSRTR